MFSVLSLRQALVDWRCSLPVLLLAWVLAGCSQPIEPADSLEQLRLGAVLGPGGEENFLRAQSPRAFQFPADHGAHPGYRSEWWYLTAMLEDEHGAEFGIQFTVFRQALGMTEENANPWRSPQIYMAHAALTAVDAQAHWEDQRFSRGHPRLAGATGTPFAVWVDGWELTGQGGGFERQSLSVAAAEFAMELQLEVIKGPVLQGDAGLSAKGPEQASYYYSVPRLQATGLLTAAGVTHQVKGSAWLDREWSTSVLSAEQQGWDWFALHFDDMTELMAFRLRRRDGARDSHDHGLAVAADNTTRVLSSADFALRPLRYWRDDSGVRWPVEWTLQVGTQSWRVEAALEDQRMDTALVYWEGLVRVFDDNGARVGSGYMELTGYEA